MRGFVWRRSKQRLYDAKDVERLQQVVSLNSVGFSLKEIKRCLDDKGFALETSLAMHQEMVQQKIEEYKRIHDTLRLMLSRLAHKQNIEIQELLSLIKEIKQMENIYTKEQLKMLKERYEKYGPDKIKEVEEGWIRLFNEFENAMEKGLDPESYEVQKLAATAQEYIDLFTGRDKEIEARLDQAYEQQKASAFQNWGVKKSVFEFATKARRIFNKK